MNARVTTICGALLLLTATGTLSAQTTRRHSLSMEAKSIASGGTTRSSNGLTIRESDRIPGYYVGRDQNFSSSRKRSSGAGLEIEVRNLSGQADTATVEWFFLGKPVSKGEPFIFNQGSRTITLRGVDSQSFVVESPELSNTVKKHLRLSSGWTDSVHNQGSASVSRSGHKLAGWIVRLVADETVLQVRASSPSFEAVGRNSGELSRFPRN